MELAPHLLAIVQRMSCSASHGGTARLSLTNAAVQTAVKGGGGTAHRLLCGWSPRWSHRAPHLLICSGVHLEPVFSRPPSL